MKINETKTQSAVEAVGLFCDKINQLKTATEDATRTVGRYGKELKKLDRRSKREKYLDSMISHLNAYHYNKKARRHYFTKQIETTQRLIKRNQ